MATLTKQMRKSKIQDTGPDKVTNVVIIVILVFMSICAIYPLWYTLIASISNPVYVNRGEIWLLPKDVTFVAYSELLENTTLWIGYRNTIFYTAANVFLELCVLLPAAYALSRPHFPGKKLLTIYLMIPMYFSGGTVPGYLLVKDLGLMDNIWVMIIPMGVVFYYLMIARNYFQSNVPESLFESARIDGANTTQFFFRFVLPLSKPIVSTLTLYYAISKWNDYMTGVMFIQDMKKQTLQVIIRQLTAEIDSSAVEMLNPDLVKEMMARQQLLKFSVVIVGAVPLMLLYPLVQKFLIGGMMVGAVKE